MTFPSVSQFRTKCLVWSFCVLQATIVPTISAKGLDSPSDFPFGIQSRIRWRITSRNRLRALGGARSIAVCWNDGQNKQGAIHHSWGHIRVADFYRSPGNCVCLRVMTLPWFLTFPLCRSFNQAPRSCFILAQICQVVESDPVWERTLAPFFFFKK